MIGSPLLQPLRIPAGWTVTYNSALYEIDPDPALIPVADRWWIFKEDMLQMRHEAENRLLDLGWYPEGDLEQGHYGLALYEGDCRGKLLDEFETRHRVVLVTKIERVLREVAIRWPR